MKITQVIIDGFKSYANRTVINGWDESFNAITGLNGSGKSNILDAICFVLGISNLSQVRCNNLQELVYKQGQSRVTKAIVTIVFDNTDVHNQPVGYDQKQITVARQVVIGGKNKYMINGHTATASAVQKLFRSVQLNVNNPHFLIMQGRITKVVNMNPKEMLSMVQEAAGVSMYETQKKQAETLMVKKQAKVEEMNAVIKDSITPQLQKFQQERSNYLKWSANNNELQRLDRLVTAFTFYTVSNMLQQQQQSEIDLKHEKESLQRQIENGVSQIEENEGEVQDLEKEKSQKQKSELHGIKQQAEDCAKSETKEQTKLQHLQQELAQKELDLKSQMDTHNELQDAIATKQQELKTLGSKVEQEEQAVKASENEITALQGQLLGVGMDNKEDGNGGSVAQQLMQAQAQAAQGASEKKNAEMKLKHAQKELQQLTLQRTKQQKQISSTEKELQQHRNNLTKLEQQHQNTPTCNPKAQQRLTKQVQQLQQHVTSEQQRVDSMSAKLSRFSFEYSKIKNFDDSKVKGLVAQLINVEDVKYITALEVTAGGRLYNVVVDTAETAKTLFTKGNLKRRVTIIPLDQIASKQLEESKIQRAQSLVGKKNANLALSMVGYDASVSKAMQFIFGKTFICNDSRSAEKVTFDKQIRTRSVTLQGDVFDAAGTLTGGSRQTSVSVLLQLQQLEEAKQQFQQQKNTLQQQQRELTSLNDAEDAQRQYQEQKELICHEIALFEARIGNSSYGQLQRQVEALEQEIKHCTEQVVIATSKINTNTALLTDLQAQINESGNDRKNRLKQTEKLIQQKKKTFKNQEKHLKQSKSNLEQLELELEACQEEWEQNKTTIEQTKVDVSTLQQSVEDQEDILKQKQQESQSAQQQLNNERKRLAQTDQAIGELTKQAAKLRKQIKENELSIKSISHKLDRMHIDTREAKQKISKMLKKYEWIEAEQHLFGQSHTDYDFEQNNAHQAKAKMEDLQREQARLSKSLNKKVMGMFEKAEREYMELLKKRDIIIQDKQKIEDVIVELDRKKNEALEVTWKQVNKDFGAIFSSLLPGTFSKLEPCEGKSILDGLEMKVAFNNVWKDSLSELSGGQRSLLSLSLILSFLLFKPAPMYILDEVDAALDLSHTQNIGRMLKTHFPQSQFIVVSLKEGMFQNANVLFRTKFVDGVSTVKRTSNVNAVTVAPSDAVNQALSKRGGKKSASSSSSSSSSRGKENNNRRAIRA